MRFTKSTFAIMAMAFTAPAMADFDVYKVNTYGTGAISESWSIFDGPPDCDQANSARVFRDRDDVSGNKLGMRCEGGCYLDNDPETIETLEMNFIEDDAHWTIYDDGSYDMIGLDGVKYGECQPDAGDDFTCEIPPLGRIIGYRKFRCQIEGWGVDELNG